MNDDDEAVTETTTLNDDFPAVSTPAVTPLPPAQPPRNASAADLLAWLLDNGWTMRGITSILPTDEQGRITDRTTLYRIRRGEYSGEQVKHRLRWLAETGGTGAYIPPPPTPPMPTPRHERRVPREPARARRQTGRRAPSAEYRQRGANRHASPTSSRPRPSRLTRFGNLLRWGMLAGTAVYTLASAWQSMLHEHPAYAVKLHQQHAAKAAARKPSNRAYTDPPAWALRVPPEVPPSAYRMPSPTPQPPAPPTSY